MTTLNLNDIVRVKLNIHGEKIYKEFYKDSPILMRIDVDNYIETELWSIMEIFGKHLFNGCRVPFVGNEVLIKERSSDPAED